MNRVSKSKRERKKEEKIRRKKHPIRNFFLFLLLIIIIISIVFYIKVQENGGGIQGALCTILGLNVEDLENLEPINVLLLGISEDIDSKLTDTIIVCSYNPKTQNAYMISIPRDTFIGKKTSSAKGGDKINTVYSKKGPEKLLDLVNDITGLNTKYYAVVNNKALIDIIDIIGGVYFDVPIDMDYDDPTQDLHIHLSKGYQLIDGEKAEQLLRFRHNNDNTSYPSEYGDNDFGRMKTQREFIKETINQTVKIENIFNSKKIIDSVFSNIETNLDKKDLYPYIPRAVEFDTNNIKNIQIPGEAQKYNNLWFFEYNKKETKKLLENIN